MPQMPKKKNAGGKPSDGGLPAMGAESTARLGTVIDLEKLKYLQDFIIKSLHVDCMVLTAEGVPAVEPSGSSACRRRSANDLESCRFVKAQSINQVRENSLPCSGTCELGVRFCYIPVFQNGQIVLFWQLSEDENHYKISPDRFHLATRAVTIFSDIITGLLDDKYNLRAQLLKQNTLTGELKEALAYTVFENEIMDGIAKAPELGTGILNALSLIGEHFGLSRITVFRSLPQLGERAVTFEWKVPAMRSLSPLLEGALSETLGAYYTGSTEERFDKHGFFHTCTMEDLPHALSDLLISDHTGEVLQAAVKRNGVTVAVITFEKDALLPKWGLSRLTGLKAAAAVISSAVLQKLGFDFADRSQAMMYTIADNNGSLTYAVNALTGRILFMNLAMQNAYPEARPGDLCTKIANLDDGERCAYCPISRFKEPGERLRYEVYNSNVNKWFDLHASRFTWFDGSDACLISTTDINKKKLFELEVEKLAYYDALLDIPNRAYLMRVLQSVFDGGAETAWGSIIILDLDEFKFVNDTLGSQYGDEMLRQIVKYFNECPDLVGKVFRFGGDEFFILLQGCEMDAAITVADELLSRFNRPWRVYDVDCTCTVSLGVAGFPKSGVNPKQLIANGEYAVYDAKATGKNRYVLYDEVLCKKIERRHKIQEIMMHALKEAKFEVYYQPIYNVDKGCFTKAEALLRLHDDELGFIPPDEFIGIAEEVGLISDIGLMVVDRVCSNLCELAKKGIVLESMAINISPLQLVQENFVDSMWSIISRYQLPPTVIEFEITENVVIRSYDAVKKTMGELQRHGINFALDDFGSGYSGLNYLMMLPISCLKIDKSYINELEDSVKSRKMLSKIIELVQDFNIQVVAEGVETKFQDSILKKFNCNFIQGYLYSRPLPKAEFEQVVTKRGLPVS
ncbi:diguanylate cyclase (GGDEF) domain-containing protein [Acetanaerobacterium elongatum]|uniref:Diguanylate cyclase (GGDEF) domain-containing protein n=2 Tax=Acetanaerobacterium elongatum TaxID=258515 RepID=A0A1H0EUM2_9FIRM|nr:diguanylate cyclase (GGDEF) domain-containing protein [Acetanaerobacterium elongatum]